MKLTRFSFRLGFSFLAGALAAPASNLALNLGPGTQAAEPGYDTVGVAIIAAADSPGTQLLGNFGGVDVSVAKDGTLGRLRNINRGDSYLNGEGPLTELCNSWIGTEAAPDGMVIVLSGIDAGLHTWSSYHVDEGTAGGQGNQNANMEVSLSLDGGSTFTVLGPHKIKDETHDGLSDPNPFTFEFAAVAGQDVHVKFVTIGNGTAGAGADFTILNGFDIRASADADSDGLPDDFEQLIIDADAGDGINTFAEVLPGDDFDSDFSTNLAEFERGTDPIEPDSDFDGFLDGHETGGGIWTSATDTGTNPLNADSDDDGLFDGEENHDLPYDPGNPAGQPGSDPNLFDTDGDAVGDADEVFLDGTDPTDQGSFLRSFPDAVAKFDINLGGSNTQFDWTAAPDGNGSDGTVTISTIAIGGAGVAGRDRNAASTDGPGADFLRNDLWRDFIFANPSTGATPDASLEITVTGLAPSTVYPFTVFAYDSSSPGARAADWSDPAYSTSPARLSFAGAAANDPTGFGDHNVTFTAFTDESGQVTVQGTVSATTPSATGPNVFLNALVIGEGTPDLDRDGLLDSFEQLIIDADENDVITSIAFVNPSDDFDADDSSNLNEQTIGTDPIDPDTDDDGALDGHETNTGLWVSAIDRGTNPFVDDTDGDGFLDGVENPDLAYDSGNPTTQPGSDPNLVDSDFDYVPDYQEAVVDGTDPNDGDDFVRSFAGSTAKFDLGSGLPQFDWIDSPFGDGTDGTVSITTIALGSATVDTRDRGLRNTDGAGGDVFNADLWGDFVFANGSFASDPTAGLQIDVTGLAPSTVYPITLAGYDQDSGGTPPRAADWGPAGLAPLVTQTFSPGLGDPTSLSDYAVTFEVLTDPSGAVSIQGVAAAIDPSASHNVFVNYLVIGAPGGAAGSIEITDISYDEGAGEFTVEWNSNLPGPFNARFGTTLDDGFPEAGPGGLSSPATIAIPAALSGESRVFLQITE